MRKSNPKSETEKRVEPVIALKGVALAELPCEYEPRHEALIAKGLAVRVGNRVVTTMAGEKVKLSGDNHRAERARALDE